MAGKRNTDGFRVYKPRWTVRCNQNGRQVKKCDEDGNAIKREASHYSVAFRDHNRTWRRLPALTDYSASIAFGRRIRELCDLRAAGESPRGDLAEWLDGLTETVREKLIEWGIVGHRAVMATMLLAEHLDAWRQSLIDKGTGAEHADLLKVRAERVVNGCNFQRYADIRPAAVERYLAERRGEGMAVRTSNFYLKAMQQFCRWMREADRAVALPLTKLKPLNAETDRRRVRRALSVDELVKLIQTAKRAPTRGRTSGPERALIYQLAAETGLRTNEIRTLTRSAFSLDGAEPKVTVEAKNSKHRREDVVPLRAELAGKLKAHLATKLPAARAFTLPTQSMKMLRADLERAGIPESTEEGVIDCHSLRVTFVTNLARGRVHPRIAQALARHSDIRLTMETYTKLGQDEERAGLASLPTIPASAEAAGA